MKNPKAEIELPFFVTASDYHAFRDYKELFNKHLFLPVNYFELNYDFDLGINNRYTAIFYDPSDIPEFNDVIAAIGRSAIDFDFDSGDEEIEKEIKERLEAIKPRKRKK